MHSLSSYDIFFRNDIKLLKTGFKCSYLDVKGANVMRMIKIWQNKTLCELCCQMCKGKIKFVSCQLGF